MEIFNLLDVNKDGEINEEEFVQVLKFYMIKDTTVLRRIKSNVLRVVLVTQT